MLKRKVDMQGFKEEVERLRRSRLIVILIVYFALVLDNMLLTVVVPIIPDYLYRQEQQTLSLLTAEAPPTPIPPPSLPPISTPMARGSEEAPEVPGTNQDSAPEGERARRDPEGSSPLVSDAEVVGDMSDDLPFALLQDRGAAGEVRRRGASRVKKGYALKASKGSFDKQTYVPLLEPEERRGNVQAIVHNSRDASSKAFVKDPDNQKHTTVPPTTPDGQRAHEGAATNNSLDERTSQPRLSQKTLVPREAPFKEAKTADRTAVRESISNDTLGNTTDEKENNSNDTLSLAKAVATPHDIINENERVGLLFSSKAFVQLLVNPLVGPLTARVGYSLPLVAGTHILILSALMFAYAESYSLMFVARSLQGIASSCIAIAGLGIVAECYPDDGERGRVQGLVMGGIALGVLAGYPAGGLLYDFTNSKTPPFLLVAGLTVVLAVIQLAVLNPRPVPDRLIAATPMKQLLRDPYILVTAGAIMVATSAMAVLEPCLPIWLTDTLHPETWQLGTAFIPDSVGYLLGTSCTAGPAFRLGRWKVAMGALVLVAIAAATVPEAQSMLALAGPHLFLGLGVGTVDATLMPLLASLVDSRHAADYGAVYAIAEAAVALAYGLGPLVGGAIVKRIGFPWLMRGVAIVNLCYCPLLILLTSFEHDPGEAQAILMAAPDPADYKGHTTYPVQPQESSLRYQKLFDEEED
ncbi:synaptic vesicular amine transporter-like [Penaeus japonicus]|uniref:synaptic vesicular amine transporter-like n=1 Tax=Penaeus japonicus TaxID=27405 RepID=UPI001C713A4C|nr:synaptic vesicular amine transporter-like [Penaeus japonicus]XP_042871829.1 synaptic vesicular amine transporter-like [Penaeus japonicus]